MFFFSVSISAFRADDRSSGIWLNVHRLNVHLVSQFIWISNRGPAETSKKARTWLGGHDGLESISASEQG